MANVKKSLKLTDQEFLDEELRRGFTLHNPGYAENMNRLALYIKNVLKAESSFEIGVGTGTLLRQMIDLGINAWGFDPSLPHKKYWDVMISGFTWTDRFLHGKEIHIQQPFDVVVSIEVLEHCTDKVIRQYLSECSKHCKYFVFSSTSQKDTPEFDEQWGHINVKSQKEWVKLFAEYGFVLSNELGFPTAWTKVFKKKE